MAETTFKLKVIATDKVFYEDDAVCLVVWNRDGQRAFLAHHEKMMCAVDVGEVDIKTPGGEWLEAVVGNGILEVGDNEINVLVDTVERADEIDEVRAREAAERAEERLKNAQSRREFYMNQAALARAMARLTFKGRHQ